MSTFQNELRVGDYGSVLGYQIVTKQVAIAAMAGEGTVDVSFTLPKCEIVDIVVDVEVAWDSDTSAVLSVGNAADPVKFANGVNVKTLARTRPTHIAAELTAMKAVAAGTYIVEVVQTGVGEAGSGNVKICYAPKR